MEWQLLEAEGRIWSGGVGGGEPKGQKNSAVHTHGDVSSGGGRNLGQRERRLDVKGFCLYVANSMNLVFFKISCSQI